MKKSEESLVESIAQRDATIYILRDSISQWKDLYYMQKDLTQAYSLMLDEHLNGTKNSR